MKKRTLFIAPIGARNKREILFDKIVSLHPSNDYSKVLYLAPNPFVVKESRRHFFSFIKKTSKKSALIPFQSMTIQVLASGLYELHEKNTAISDKTRTLMLCELLGEKNIGMANILSGLYKKIRHYIPDNSLPWLKDEMSSLIFEERTLNRAIKAVETLESYESQLKNRNLTDPEDILKYSISILKELIKDFDTLVIDGFFDPTPLELKVIRSLLDKIDNSLILAEEDSVLSKSITEDISEISIVSLKRSSARKSAGYFSYPSREEEVEDIARQAKKLLLAGIRPGEIAVCFPQISKYLAMLRRIFRKHGIPLSIESFSLSATGPFVALEEMMTCIEEDYPRDAFISFLISPHFPQIPGILKEWAHSCSYRAGIVKGKSTWLSIKDVIMNSGDAEIQQDEKERLDELQNAISRVISKMEEIKKQNDFYSFTEAFESALNSFGYFESHGSPDNGSIRNQLSELRRLGNICGENYQNIGKPALYLRFLLGDLQGSDDAKEGVKVLPFELAAVIETKALFFGGLMEGDFPSRPGIDPVLPEKVKQSLGMPYLEYYLDRQKKYFTRLLNISELEPYLSFTSAEADKVFLPSPFLEWDRLLTAESPDIHTEEDVLISEGAFKMTDAASALMWDGKMFLGKGSSRILQEQISSVSKGYHRVTDIDYYRKCPMRFYIEKVLCLEIEEVPKFEIEARLWGSLAHRIMEHLFADGDFKIDEIEKRLFSSLEKSLKEFPIAEFWAGVAREIFKNLIPLLKEQEIQLRDIRFYPYMMEKPIRADLSNALKLKGKIDRIDKKQSTVNSQQSTVILLDYKTGSVDKDSLQLPLYALMWEKTYKEPVDKTGYYSLKEGSIEWQPVRKDMEEFKQDALKAAEEIVNKMKKGIFLPEPAKPAECRYCYHSPLCERMEK